MRPIERGAIPLDKNGNPKTYSKYKYAKRDLFDRIGRYCSYCERKISANMHVEHVRPKGLNPGLSLTWDNFLLACVNCNSTKGKGQIVLNDYYWPDRHNTHLIFDYRDTGFVIPSNNHNLNRSTIISTINLTGLDVIDVSEDGSDTRWEERLETLSIANEELVDFELTARTANDIRSIVRTALGHGFWSVWMKVFENHQPVQNALIAAFSGTFPNCRTTDINRD